MEAERLDAAEEVCWTLIIMMEAGGLPLRREWRDFLGPEMDRWADLAVEAGIMDDG